MQFSYRTTAHLWLCGDDKYLRLLDIMNHISIGHFMQSFIFSNWIFHPFDPLCVCGLGLILLSCQSWIIAIFSVNICEYFDGDSIAIDFFATHKHNESNKICRWIKRMALRNIHMQMPVGVVCTQHKNCHQMKKKKKKKKKRRRRKYNIINQIDQTDRRYIRPFISMIESNIVCI